MALTALWRDGVVVVVPTGNDGPSRGSVTSPGSDPTLLTVGALDERLTADRSDDVVPAFSGRGPAPQDVAKPDLVAPGRSLVSLRAVGSTVDAANLDAVVDGAYFRGSRHQLRHRSRRRHGGRPAGPAPDLDPDQVKALLTGTAYAAKGLRDVRDAGAGGLDVAAALTTDDTAGRARSRRRAAAGRRGPGGLACLPAGAHGRRPRRGRAGLGAPWPRGPQVGCQQLGRPQWGAHKWGAHKWGANSWSAHKWAGADGTAEEWESRFWAAHKWAAHNWASDEFVAHKWAAHKWAAHKWADEDFVAHKWAAHNWAAHNWAAHTWSAHDWS